ncbi:hypothetical protein J0A67_06845 [Algoriphagus aestuariicola]|jgi:hypothetical protein|uniref:Uncharacterized protein n=1 Tax=Algoriphagus aestuariicola TaxID=1852016 RepID=A0ABS3BNE5_9BACT|nr:hypothetical protein [Algoriphagus aestuariicola]MBN7800570.1 hypothetical protein [Algoriphagus aestuariicola]
METNISLSLKPLIEELILADLKHCQLIFGLAALGLDPLDNHFLGLGNLIANWMGFKTDQEMDMFFDIYQVYMSEATAFPISQDGRDLKSLASECFLTLHEKAQMLGLPEVSISDLLHIEQS